MIKRTYPYDVNVVFEKKVFEADGFRLPYRLYIPKDYDCGERYPLLVFLHGAGERGNDNERQLSAAIQKMFDDPGSPVYDSIVIAPQCSEGSQWVYTPWTNNYSTASVPESRELECVISVIDEIRGFCNIDDDRVYITGLSMGGFGTWDLLSRHGARFAAGMPICGGGDPSYAKLLKRIPIRTFHGSEDASVPTRCTRLMYAAIRREGGENIEYTEFDGCGHNVWDMVYSDRENLDWLFSQSREERRLRAERNSRLKKAAAAGGAGALISALLIIVGTRRKRRK